MLLLTNESFPHYGIERFFAFAEKAGYKGVEIHINRNFDTQNPTYLAKLAAQHKVEIRAFSLTEKNPTELFKPFQDTVREFPGATLNLPSPETFDFGFKKWINITIPKLCRKYELKLNRKNSEFKTIFGIIPRRSENSLYSLREKGSVSLDISALWSSKQEIMRTIDLVGTKLRHVYLSNVHQGRPYYRLEAGVLPVESFLTKLAQKQFGGDFTLKINPKAIGEGNEELILKNLKEEKDFFTKYFREI